MTDLKKEALVELLKIDTQLVALAFEVVEAFSEEFPAEAQALLEKIDYSNRLAELSKGLQALNAKLGDMEEKEAA